MDMTNKFFVALILLLFMSCSYSSSPKVMLEIIETRGVVDFQIQCQGGNGLISLDLWQAESREVLWAINLNYFKEGKITYGVVPKNFRTFTGVVKDAAQQFPKQNRKPPPLPASSKFFLSLQYQYDAEGAASVTTFYFTFTTDERGMISSQSPLSKIQKSEFPKDNWESK